MRNKAISPRAKIAVLSGIIAARIFHGGAQLTTLRRRWLAGPPRCPSSPRSASSRKFILLGRAMACLANLGKSQPAWSPPPCSAHDEVPVLSGASDFRAHHAPLTSTAIEAEWAPFNPRHLVSRLHEEQLPVAQAKGIDFCLDHPLKPLGWLMGQSGPLRPMGGRHGR